MVAEGCYPGPVRRDLGRRELPQGWVQQFERHVALVADGAKVVHDRTEPIANAITLKDVIRGRSLTGFNVAQVGLEVPTRLFHAVGNSTGRFAPPDVSLYFVPFGAYSYHISDPTPGTDRNEFWGGAKFTLTF